MAFARYQASYRISQGVGSMTATAVEQKTLTVQEHLEQWHPLILKFAGSTARKYRLDSEELVQYVVATALANYPSFDPRRARFGRWLEFSFMSALDQAIRDRKHYPHRPVSLSDHLLCCDPNGSRVPTVASILEDHRTPCPADSANVQILQEHVATAMATLDPDERELIRGRFWGGEKLPRNDRLRARFDAAMAKLKDAIPADCLEG